MESKVLVVAHGNSIRAMVKILDDLSDSEIIDVNIPTGIPLAYNISESSVHKIGYLEDEEKLINLQKEVKLQSKLNSEEANLLSMDTITAILITVHIIISIALIALVLLNSGKGGGLSDMLGGPGSSGNIGQTLAERNLSRITAVVALLFAATTLYLFWFLD